MRVLDFVSLCIYTALAPMLQPTGLLTDYDLSRLQINPDLI